MVKTLKPASFLFTYMGIDGEEFTVTNPIAAIPVRVIKLFTEDQIHMVQESIKTECALIVKGVINGNIYADRMKTLETFK